MPKTSTKANTVRLVKRNAIGEPRTSSHSLPIVDRTASKAFDALSQFSGPAQTVAASLPSDLAKAVRAKIGRREFSHFVSRAVARDYIELERAEYVAQQETLHGPVDEALVRELEDLFAR